MATRSILRRRPQVLAPTTVRVSYTPEATLADVLTQLAYVFFAILESLLILRFVLRLAGADPFNVVVTWVYNTTSFFTLPFESMFPSAGNANSVLEVGTLVGMVAYLFVFYVAVAIFRMFVPGEQVVDPEGRY